MDNIHPAICGTIPVPRLVSDLLQGLTSMKVVVLLLSTPSFCSHSGLNQRAEDPASTFVAGLRLRALILQTEDIISSPFAHHVLYGTAK